MDNPLLHIYAQSGNHDEAFIVANEEGIHKLILVLQMALEHQKATGLFFVTDGEGFYPIVIKTDDATIDKLVFPYTDDFYHIKGDEHAGPGDREPLVPTVLSREEYRKLVKSDDEITYL